MKRSTIVSFSFGTLQPLVLLALRCHRRSSYRPVRAIWVLALAALVLAPSSSAQQPTPVQDDATAREQSTLPPGYTVFSVDTAERSLLKNYPHIKRLSTTLPAGVKAHPGL